MQKKEFTDILLSIEKNYLVLDKNRAWLVKKLNIQLMKKAAKILSGTHNFNAFRSSSCGAKSPVRTIEKSTVIKKGEKILIVFSSKSFLQQQVRSMVGCLKMIGEEKWNLDDLKNLFKLKKKIFMCTTSSSEWIISRKSYLLIDLIFFDFLILHLDCEFTINPTHFFAPHLQG